MIILRRILLLLFLSGFISSFSVKNFTFSSLKKIDPPFVNKNSEWADSVLASLSLEEKIAQSIMIAAYSNRENKHQEELAHIIKKHKVGGVIFFQGGPVRQALLNNYLQSISTTPLLIAIDAEWGLGMRLDSTISYPWQMMLGAIENNELIFTMGQDIAQQLKRLGVHISFAPVVDINSDPLNPVINARSFGENKYNVAEKGLVYMHGLQRNNIIATAKHFPGHGDTYLDSHLTLPIIHHIESRIDDVELFPFKELINSGLSAVMTAHLNIPSLDPEPNKASSLSYNIVTNKLQNELNFNGLIFTDALGMNGVSNYYQPGDLELEAYRAGNDILLMPEDVSKAISFIKKEVKRGNIPEEEINRRCLKIIKAKEWAGLDNYKPVEIDHLVEDLNAKRYEIVKRKLVESSITIIKNEQDLLPLKRLDTLKVASISFNSEEKSTFQTYLEKYKYIAHFQVDNTTSEKELKNLTDSISAYNLVICAVHGTSRKASSNYGIPEWVVKTVGQIANKTNTILDIFGIPYGLSVFNNLDSIRAILVSYENTSLSQEISAQIIFGGISASGILPVTSASKFPEGISFKTKATRMHYGIPEESGMNSNHLAKIDSIALDAIEKKATPGCQIVVARKGNVVYQKSFGYYTYLKREKVDDNSIYDLASLTKVLATLPALMSLYDSNKIKLDDPISEYLPYLDTTNKKDIILEDILTHQAQLAPWIPFYVSTLENWYKDNDLFSKNYSNSYPIQLGKKHYIAKHTKYTDGTYSFAPSDSFSVKVAENLYIKNTYVDSMFFKIASSELLETKNYRYSDLGYYLFHQLIENMIDENLEDYVQHHFYSTLGADLTGYLPLERFDKKNIVPTENDIYFRKQLLQGNVHDPGAAMLGGVAGHAGLFGNANDLAKIMQMYLQYGEYGGIDYIKKKTIKEFTSCPHCKEGNRRGIGFDKPQLKDTQGPVSEIVPKNSFGHTGFTGTLAWADPDEEIVYIFLSNRVHPDPFNTKLLEMDVRTKIQDVIYESIVQ